MILLEDIRKGCSPARHAHIVRTIVEMSGESVGNVLAYVKARTGRSIDREDYDRLVRYIPSSSSRKVPGVKSAPDTTPMLPRWDRAKVSI
jgi:hypothetical protein